MPLLGIFNYILDFYTATIEVWINRYWPRVEPYYKVAKSVLFHSVVAFAITSFCLYISAFLFGIVYYYNMPTIYHSFDVYFQYNRRCIQQHRNYVKHGNSEMMYEQSCYPKADVYLDHPSRKNVDPKQLYGVYLSLEVPESPTNLDIGMFMVTMRYGQMEISHPVSLRYRPPLTRVCYMLLFWPLYLFDLLETKQTLKIPLFEEVAFHYPTKNDIGTCTEQSLRIYSLEQEIVKIEQKCKLRVPNIQIDYPDIEIYSAQLHLTAAFSGLQYFFFQWPVFSFLVGTTIFFVPALSSALVMLYLIFCVRFRADTTCLPQSVAGYDTEPIVIGNEENNPDATLAEDQGDRNDGDSQNSSVASSSIEVIGSPSVENIFVGQFSENQDSSVLPLDEHEQGCSSESGVAEETTVRKRK